MELSCTENMTTSINFAYKDPVIFSDARVIDSLLNDQVFYIPSCNYFEDVQTDIQPFMRNVVATWMMEVCEEQMCEEQVFPLACNYMDRFLCSCPIKRQQLQLLGATCLLIASKIRSNNNLSIDLLCAYTDYSVTYEHISTWEILILSKLQWNAAAITGFDFIDQIIGRFSWGSESQFLRRHAHTLVSICYIESSLIQTPPSLIASACICSAMNGLRLTSTETAKFDICNLLHIEPAQLELLRQGIDMLVEKGVPKTIDSKPGSASSSNSCLDNGYDSPTYRQPETPTEVDSIYF